MIKFVRLLAPLISLAFLAPCHAATVDAAAIVRDVTFSYSVVAYPFVASPFNDVNTYKTSIAPQSALLTVPPLWVPGRLNSVNFQADGWVSGTFRSYFDAMPDLDLDGSVYEPWRPHGGHTVTGRISLLANNIMLGSTTFSFFEFGSCSGVAPRTCERQFGSEFTGPVISGGDLGTVDGSEMPTLQLVLDELTVFGRFNDDRGSFFGGEYSGEWTFHDNIFLTYDYTPLSEVPLPGAVWLFLSALSALGFMRFRRERK